jgi:hypothetical protein
VLSTGYEPNLAVEDLKNWRNTDLSKRINPEMAYTSEVPIPTRTKYVMPLISVYTDVETASTPVPAPIARWMALSAVV